MSGQNQRGPKRTPEAMAEAHAVRLQAIAEKAIRQTAQVQIQLERALERAALHQEQAQKKADDRVKVLVGACVGHAMSRGRAIAWSDARALLDELGRFLVRPKEREAVLGAGHGSEAFWRVCGAAAEDQGSD